MMISGPDSFGHKCLRFGDNNFHLFHSRLAIFDLKSRSNQPYKFKNKILAFNGAIYNYRELKEILISKNYKFSSESDTEVLVKMIDCFGDKAFDYLEGMWAIAIFDIKTNQLILSRDRFGEKPLFFKRTKNGLYFASQQNYINILENKHPEINKSKINTFLRFGYKSSFKNKDSFLSNIEQLYPSENLYFINNKLIKKKYWKIQIKKNHIYKRVEDCISDIKHSLIESLKLRLRSDVDCGFLLSGGIDSGSLVSISKKILEEKTKIFSVYDTKSVFFNEDQNINNTLRDNNIRSNKKVYINKINFFDELNGLTKNNTSPVLNINFLPLSKIYSNAKRNNTKVMINGNGADEIFAGYYDHYLFYLQDTRKFNRDIYNSSYKSWKKNVRKMIRNKAFKNLKKKHHIDHMIGVNDNFSKFIKNEKYFFDNKKDNISSYSLKNLLNFQLNETISPALFQDDLCAMKNAIENRSPFLDRNLVEKAFHIPNQYYMYDSKSKYILREAMKNILNETVRTNTKKVGFNCSLKSFMDTSNNSIRSYVIDNIDLIKDFINKKKVINFINKINVNNLEYEEEKFVFRLLSTISFINNLKI